MNKAYRQQVELLLKIIPTLSGIDSFAVQGGTAINLYVLDFPRYSVDIDVTYTPIKSREEAFAEIHKNLSVLKEKIKAIIPNVIISEKLIDFINSNLTQQDKEFLIAFEAGSELLQFSEYQEYLQFPSVQWKLQNINKLKKINPNKHRKSVKKLENYLMQK